MKKKVILFLACTTLLGAQHVYAENVWTRFTNWFSEKPAALVGVSLFTGALAGWYLYKKYGCFQHRAHNVRLSTTQSNQSEWVEKSLDILRGRAGVEELVPVDEQSDTREFRETGWKMGTSIKHWAQGMLQRPLTQTNRQKLEQNMQLINSIGCIAYVDNVDKRGQFLQAVQNIVEISTQLRQETARTAVTRSGSCMRPAL